LIAAPFANAVGQPPADLLARAEAAKAKAMRPTCFKGELPPSHIDAVAWGPAQFSPEAMTALAQAGADISASPRVLLAFTQPLIWGGGLVAIAAVKQDGAWRVVRVVQPGPGIPAAPSAAPPPPAPTPTIRYALAPALGATLDRVLADRCLYLAPTGKGMGAGFPMCFDAGTAFIDVRSGRGAWTARHYCGVYGPAKTLAGILGDAPPPTTSSAAP
jgi:hypothetical protein